MAKNKGQAQTVLRYIEPRWSVTDYLSGFASSGIAGFSAWWEDIPLTFSILAIALAFVIGIMLVRLWKARQVSTTDKNTGVQIPWPAIATLCLLLALIATLIAKAGNANNPVVQQAQGERESMLNKFRATPAELEAQRVADRTVRLSDIPRDGGAITGKVFESCNIIGPGVIAMGWKRELPGQDAAVEPFMFSECSFDAKIDSLMIVVEENAPLTRGTVLFDGCMFRNCRFIDVGLIGTAADKEETLKTSPGLR